MTLLTTLVRLLAPVALRVAETAIDRVTRSGHTRARRPHYYRSGRNADGTWWNDDTCAHCPRYDPAHRLYTDPPCSRDDR